MAVDLSGSSQLLPGFTISFPVRNAELLLLHLSFLHSSFSSIQLYYFYTLTLDIFNIQHSYNTLDNMINIFQYQTKFLRVFDEFFQEQVLKQIIKKKFERIFQFFNWLRRHIFFSCIYRAQYFFIFPNYIQYMLSTKAPHKKQEPITLRDYLQRYSLMKKVRSTGDLTKEGRTFSIQPKPEDEFMTQMNDLKAFLQQKIKDTILKAKIKKKILHLTNLFKKTLDKWKFPLQKKTFTHHPTHFEQFPKKEVNKLPTQPKIPQYQTKTSFEVSNENIPIQKIGKSKTSRLEKKVSINVEDSNEIIPAIIPSIMRLPSNQQLIKNKNLQWMRSSNIIEQKEGDYDDSPRRSQKNTNQSLQQRIKKQKQQKEKEKLKLKNETRNYKPPQIEKKISAFDYSILNLNY